MFLRRLFFSSLEFFSRISIGRDLCESFCRPGRITPCFLRDVLNTLEKMAAASSVDSLSFEILADIGCRVPSMSESIRSQSILR